jgi:hypothetical protein
LHARYLAGDVDDTAPADARRLQHRPDAL